MDNEIDDIVNEIDIDHWYNGEDEPCDYNLTGVEEAKTKLKALKRKAQIRTALVVIEEIEKWCEIRPSLVVNATLISMLSRLRQKYLAEQEKE